MGRKRKYNTKKERQEAQRKWQMEHYLRNKEEIKQKEQLVTSEIQKFKNELVSEIGSYKQLLAERKRYLDNETYFSYLKLAKTN